MSINKKNIVTYLRLPFYGLVGLYILLLAYDITQNLFVLWSSIILIAILIISFEIFLKKLITQNLSDNSGSDTATRQLRELNVSLGKDGNTHQIPDRELRNVDIIFQRFWEISVDGMRMTDDAGKILAVNNAFCKTMEMEANKLIDSPFSIAYHENEKQDAINKYQTDLKNSALETHFERERLLWNGKKVWLEFSNSFLELPGYGKIVLSVINDITQRKLSEIKIQNSEKRFRTLFNNADDAVFVNHFTSDLKFGPFTEVNDLACLRLRYSRDEIISLNPYDIFPQRFYTEIDKVCQELTKTGHAVFEAMQIRKDRRQFPVEVKSHLFELDGQPSILSIARDITDRKRAEQRLNVTSQRLRNLASRLQTIREEERTAIAREIHDELGQSLTVLKIQTSLLLNKLKLNQPELETKTESIMDLIDQTVESVQKISAKLRPGILDELGLVPAIEWQSREFHNRTGIYCDYTLPKNEVNLSDEKATAIFRIFQEALTNVARHADAKKVSVILKQEDNQLTLEVTDNGQGITSGQKEDPNSLGLLGMKERALIFGGEVILHGVSGRGTNVKVQMPLDIENGALPLENQQREDWT